MQNYKMHSSDISTLLTLIGTRLFGISQKGTKVVIFDTNSNEKA